MGYPCTPKSLSELKVPEKSFSAWKTARSQYLLAVATPPRRCIHPMWKWQVDTSAIFMHRQKVYHRRMHKKTLRYTTPMSQTRIGIFGGTFDPPHIGHLILAGEAVIQFNLNRLLWVLTPDPPHKLEKPITPLIHRLPMLQTMIQHNPIFELSRIEIDRPGPHYTFDTVRLITDQNPDAELHLLIGGDSLRDLSTWRLPLDLVAAVSKIGVMRRPGDFTDLHTIEAQIPGVTAKIQLIDALLQPVSSSELRRRIAKGEMYRYYVTPDVYDYIETHHLYR
jgi:nicotinate-nucleotide adenylyltransferase